MGLCSLWRLFLLFIDMRRIEKNYKLFEGAPDLIKEWHPTANGNLTPRNVKISHPKRVWWICNKSHKWMATIKSRINGYGCPQCRKDVVDFQPHDDKAISRQKYNTSYTKKIRGEKSVFLELDSVNPQFGRDFRKAKRFKTNSTAIVEIPSTEHWFYAEMKNVSSGGMYLEVDASIDRGTNIKINLDRPLFKSDHKKFNSIVRWCRKLEAEDKSHYSFGIGSKFV